jgi:hypothetical protein
MSQPRTRRQHTAARFYLRGFADAAGQVCAHGRDGTVSRRNVGSAAVIRDFYTYTDDAGRPDEQVERWFAQRIEDPAAAVLRSIRAGNDPNTEELPVLSAFAASSLVRTATVRSLMEQIDTHLRPLLVLHHYATQAGVDLTALTDHERRRLLEATRQALAGAPSDHDEQRRSQLRTMLRKTDEWQALMAGWNWEVLRAPRPVLITGDAPVVVLGHDPTRGWQGILPADGTIAVPVAPTALLLGSPSPLLGDAALSDGLAARVNAGAVTNCHRAAYHHPDTPWSPDLAVPAAPPTLPAPTITWSRPADETPTFPAQYPPIIDPAVRRVLDALDATDTVE